MKAALSLAVLALAPALAGCLVDGGTDPADPGSLEEIGWRFEDFIEVEHDHLDFAAHAVTSPTIEPVAHLVLGDAPGEPYSYIGEMDTRGDLAVVSVVGAGSTPGFVLLDVSEPASPTVLSRATMATSYVVDVKLSWDGQYVFAATQLTGSRRADALTGGIGSPDATTLMQNGVAIWDVSDPTAPRAVGFHPYEYRGCHMVSYAEVAGSEWLFCIEQALQVLAFERGDPAVLVPQATYYPFGPEATLASAERRQGAPTSIPGMQVAHDATFQFDPLDGRPLLVVSHWDLGFDVLDLSDPAVPSELFRWIGEGAEHYRGDAHGGQLAVLDGRRILVVGPETTADYVPALWFLDVTDWETGTLVAEWTNPGEKTSLGLLMTTHQIQLVGERLYLSYNHNGLWVLDLATVLEAGGNTPDAREVLGVHVPHTPVALYDEKGGRLEGVPAVWDVNVIGGHIYGTDRYTGVHVVRMVDDPIDPSYTSIG